jgi:hypothetical protein
LKRRNLSETKIFPDLKENDDASHRAIQSRLADFMGAIREHRVEELVEMSSTFTIVIRKALLAEELKEIAALKGT